jgi:HK97 family phage prohead protease
MTMEIKRFNLSLKAEGDSRLIEGYGSVYGNVDGGNDIVMPGAFAKCITRMKSTGEKPKMLWQHNTDMPIGVWDQFDENPQGLMLKGQIVDTAHGMDAYKLVKAGAINGLSIGYSVKEYSLDKKTGTRLLKELELYEVSLVTFPMNEKATITSVKSASGDIDTAVTLLQHAVSMCEVDQMTPEMQASTSQLINLAISLLDEQDQEATDTGEMSKPEDERALEKCLRDAGYSRCEAKKIVSEGYKALVNQRDAETQNLERLHELLTQFKL